MRTGYSVQSVDEYRALKKAMALYAKYEYKFDDETITVIAAKIGRNVKDTKEIIRAGIDSAHYTDFYRKYADEDDESTADNVTVDYTSNPEKLYFKQWLADGVFSAYESLDYRERSMVADHLGFCPECYGICELSKDENGNSVKLLRKGKAYIDLAAEHMLSSPDTAFQIINGAYGKMLIELAIDEYIHIAELRLKSADNITRSHTNTAPIITTTGAKFTTPSAKMITMYFDISMPTERVDFSSPPLVNGLCTTQIENTYRNTRLYLYKTDKRKSLDENQKI